MAFAARSRSSSARRFRVDVRLQSAAAATAVATIRREFAQATSLVCTEKHILQTQTFCAPSAFAPNRAALSLEDTLYVEDFDRLKSVQPQPALNALNLSVSIAAAERQTHAQFYETAIANLRRAAPRLNTIGLFGSLRFWPRISVSGEALRILQLVCDYSSSFFLFSDIARAARRVDGNKALA